MSDTKGLKEKSIKFAFPSDDLTKEYLWAATDEVCIGIFKYIKEHKNREVFFNKMARDLAKSVASRRTLFGRLVRLENANILLADMRHITNYGESHIQRWIKEYKIADKHLPWIEKALSID